MEYELEWLAYITLLETAHAELMQASRHLRKMNELDIDADSGWLAGIAIYSQFVRLMNEVDANLARAAEFFSNKSKINPN